MRSATMSKLLGELLRESFLETNLSHQPFSRGTTGIGVKEGTCRIPFSAQVLDRLVSPNTCDHPRSTNTELLVGLRQVVLRNIYHCKIKSPSFRTSPFII